MDLDKLIDFCVSGSKNDKVMKRKKKKRKKSVGALITVYGEV